MVAEAVSRLNRNDVDDINAHTQEIDTKMEAQNVLSRAVVIGNLPLVISLLKRTSPVLADVNIESPYFGRPLQLAAAWGHLEIVRHLLDYGSNPHANDEAKSSRDVSGELRLSDRNVYRSPEGSALRAAVLGGHEDIVRLLLEPEYRLSPSKPEYLRAIVAGARGGHIHLISLLLQVAGKTLSEYKELGGNALGGSTP
jgi:hypothetical protein